MLWSLSAITATKEEHILISQGWIQDWTRKRFVPTPGFQSCSCQLARHTSASWIVVSKFNLTSFSIIVLFIYLYKRTLWCYYFYPVKYSENFQVLLQSYNNNLFFEGKNNFFFKFKKKDIVIIAGVWNAAGGTRFQKSLSSETKKCLFWEGSLSFSVKRHGKKVL